MSDTPRTDAVDDVLHAGCEERADAFAAKARELEIELALKQQAHDELLARSNANWDKLKAQAEDLAMLREWKRQQLLVESWWAKIDEFVRSQPDARLGESVSGTALKWLRELPALREDKARLDWLENSGAKVFRETEESVACMKIVVALEIGQDFPPQFTVRGCLDAARKAAP